MSSYVTFFWQNFFFLEKVFHNFQCLMWHVAKNHGQWIITQTRQKFFSASIPLPPHHLCHHYNHLCSRQPQHLWLPPLPSLPPLPAPAPSPPPPLHLHEMIIIFHESSVSFSRPKSNSKKKVISPKNIFCQDNHKKAVPKLLGSAEHNRLIGYILYLNQILPHLFKQDGSLLIPKEKEGGGQLLI